MSFRKVILRLINVDIKLISITSQKFVAMLCLSLINSLIYCLLMNDKLTVSSIEHTLGKEK